MRAHHRGELGGQDLAAVEALLYLFGETRRLFRRRGVHQDGADWGAVGVRFPHHLQHALDGPRSGACLREPLDLAVVRREHRLESDPVAEPRRRLGDVAAPGKILKGVQHGIEVHLRGDGIHECGGLVQRSPARREPRRFEGDQPLSAGHRRGGHRPDPRPGEPFLGQRHGVLRGAVARAQAGGQRDAKHRLRSLARRLERLKILARRRRRRRWGTLRLTEQAVEIARRIDAVAVHPAIEDQVVRDDLDPVGLGDLPGNAGGAIGDDRDFLHSKRMYRAGILRYRRLYCEARGPVLKCERFAPRFDSPRTRLLRRAPVRLSETQEVPIDG